MDTPDTPDTPNRTDSTVTPPASNYSPPVDTLLALGIPAAKDAENWPNYLDLGLTRADIPALIRMATDKELNEAPSENLDGWAPIHAWRALGQLRAIEAIEPFLTMLDQDEYSEWILEELPEVFGLIGPEALPKLTAYLLDKTHSEWPRVVVATSIRSIAERWPETRSESIVTLIQALENGTPDETELNTFVIDNLIKLQAEEAIPAIEKAYDNDLVETFIIGNWDDTRERLGLLSPEEVEQRRANKLAEEAAALSGLSPSSLGFFRSGDYEPTPSRTQSASKKKAKNKMAKQSRKKNRKR